MANRSVTSFKTTKNSRFADSTTGDISAADSRDMYEDVADSFVNKTDGFIDDDSMATASATKVPSSESVVAYIAAQLLSGRMQSVTVTLSAAEILAGNSSPKLVLAAPGANKVIIVQRTYLNYTFVSAAYTTNTNLNIVYDDNTTSAIAYAGELALTSSRWHVGNPNTFGVTGSIINRGLKVRVDTGDPLAGDATIKIVLQYTVIDV